MSEPPVEALAANVAQSAQTAERILRHFEDSLRQGGFAEGAGAYRKLADTLAHQRSWAQAHLPAEVTDPAYGRAAGHARRILELLDPYVDSMRRIAFLGAGEAPPPAPPPGAPAADGPEPTSERPSPPLAEQVLGALRGESALSQTALRARLACPRRALEAVLEDLEGRGLVRVRQSSGRRLLTLA